ncbi:S-methyl-5'-thioinosine phosphorylase [bacterium]|nr:S-methyl-5'-thioinosine phosphorylase [bacterium]
MSTLALIGGTGLDDFDGAQRVRSADATTPWGDASAAPVLLDIAGAQAWFLPRHGADHSLAPHAINYRANIAALQAADAQQIVAVAAVGGISAEMQPGRIVLVDDLIDYTTGRDHTYSDGPDAPLQHIEFAPPYDAGLRERLLLAADAAGVELIDGGVMGVTNGPRLETAAEIRRMARDGCDVVGMTGMPEAALAVEKRMAYAGLAVVVNPAAGTADGPIHAAIEQTLSAAMRDVRAVLRALIGAQQA